MNTTATHPDDPCAEPQGGAAEIPQARLESAAEVSAAAAAARVTPADAPATASHPDDPLFGPPDGAAQIAEVRLESAAESPDAAEEHDAPAAHASLGARLRLARESRGWSAEDVGNRLHLPVQIIQTLEAEHYDRIGYGIYLRGYLNNYARLVDLPTVLVDAVMNGRDRPPPLVASGTISHSRYLYQRYSVSALYVILTGVIIVPAVLLAMRTGLQPESVAELTSLDVPARSAAVPPAPSAPQTDHTGATPAAAVAPARPEKPSSAGSDTPLVASIAPFSALSRKDKDGAGDGAAAEQSVPAPAAVAAAEPAGHTLRLTLKQASWVEVVTDSGDKLEYDLLPAGTTRTYTSDGVLEVRLGNAEGAEVVIDGQLQDLAPYRHANVAHFKLFAPGETISRTDS